MEPPARLSPFAHDVQQLVVIFPLVSGSGGTSSIDEPIMAAIEKTVFIVPLDYGEEPNDH